MYSGHPITIDGILVTEHAINRYMERISGPDVSPMACARLLVAAFHDGITIRHWQTGFEIWSELLPDDRLVVSPKSRSVVTVLSGRGRWVQATLPLMRAIERTLCRTQ